MQRSRFNWVFKLAVAWVTLSIPTLVLADGGKVQFSQIVTPYRITVFTSPTPAQAGPIDASVLVQDAETGSVVHDAVVELTWKHESSSTVLRHHATHDQSTNKLMQSAKFELPAAGIWNVTLNLREPATAAVNFEVVAYQGTNSWAMVAFLVTLPFAAIGLFLLREHITLPSRAYPNARLNSGGR